MGKFWCLFLVLAVLMAVACSDGTGSEGPTSLCADRVCALGLTPHSAFAREHMAELGVDMSRHVPGPFIWNQIDREGHQDYDWSRPDALIAREQAWGITPLVVLFPYHEKDQQGCREPSPGIFDRNPDFGHYASNPCNMAEWAQFVGKLVERYDADGIDDMPGLTAPVEHFEVLSKPGVEEESERLYSGDSVEYAELLTITARSIHRANPHAQVLNGSMTGADQEGWWQDVDVMGGLDEVDIVSIQQESVCVPMDLTALHSGLLAGTELADNPIWVTGVELGYPGGQGPAPVNWEYVLTEAHRLTFEAGRAERIFCSCYDQGDCPDETWLIRCEDGSPLCTTTDIYFAYETMARGEM